jgi:hypothetical protein
MSPGKIQTVTEVNAIAAQARPSWLLHWFGWSFLVGIAALFLIFSLYEPKYSDSTALGAIANQNQAKNFATTGIFMSVLITFLTSWVPAALTFRISKSNFKKTQTSKADPIASLTDQGLVDLIDAEFNQWALAAQNPWIATNWSKLKDEEKINWVSDRRNQLNGYLTAVNGWGSLINALQQADKDFSRKVS